MFFKHCAAVNIIGGKGEAGCFSPSYAPLYHFTLLYTLNYCSGISFIMLLSKWYVFVWYLRRSRVLAVLIVRLAGERGGERGACCGGCLNHPAGVAHEVDNYTTTPPSPAAASNPGFSQTFLAIHKWKKKIITCYLTTPTEKIVLIVIRCSLNGNKLKYRKTSSVFDSKSYGNHKRWLHNYIVYNFLS